MIEVNPQAEQASVKPTSKGAIIVTGASRGIGAAIARQLAADGHPVIVNYSHNRGAAEGVVQSITQDGGKAAFFGANVSRETEISDLVRFAADTFGPLAGVVNNASGPIDPKSFEELTWDSIQRHIDVQLKATFLLSQAIRPHLIAAGGGSIVNISTVAADNVPPLKWLSYTTVKAALSALSKSLAAELGPAGIRVNCVSPGMTPTDLIADVPEKVQMLTKMQTPTRRLTTPDDVAGTVAFLFSDRARQITGQNIRVCGGIVMA